MVNITNQNDIVLDILGRVQEALAEAKGELTPELVKGVEAGIRSDWGVIVCSSRSAAERAIATATAASSATTWRARE